MKKIILSALGMMFIVSSAFAASMGLSGTAIYYDASGTETTKSSNEKNNKSDTGVAPIASIFIENEFGTAGSILGLEVVPYGAKVADFDNARTDTDTDDASDTAGNNTGDVNFKNLITLYLEQPINGAIDGAFVRFGVSQVTIETDEEVATGSTYGDETVNGLTIGFGKKGDTANGGFYKIVGEISRFQGATFDGSNDSDSVKNSITLDDFNTAAIRFSVGKSF